MKKLLCSAVIFGLLLSGCSSDSKDSTNGDKKKFKIGVLQLITHDALDASYKGFKDGMKELGYTQGENIEYDFLNPEGDQSNLSQMANQLVSNEPDLILGIATNSVLSLSNETKDIPVVGTAITSYEDAGLVKTDKKPGGNVTGTSDTSPMDKQIQLMLDLNPNIKTVGILYTSSEANSEIQANQAKKELEARNLKVVVKTVSDKTMIDDTMQAFVGNVEAIYIPTDNNIASSMASVDIVARENKILTIVGESNMVANGGAASVGVDYYKLGKQTAKMADRILKGEKPADMPIETLSDVSYYYNSKTLKALGLELPASLKDAIDKAK